MPSIPFPILLAAAFDAAVLYGLWRLATRLPGGRMAPARRQAKTVEQELRTSIAMHRDLLPAGVLADLEGRLAALRAARRSARRPAWLRLRTRRASKALEAAIAAHAPKRRWPGLFALMETLVVTFGVAGGLRAYFLQPFKIPTGSMQPTLYGMHSEACAEPTLADRALPLKLLKWAFTGRWYRDVVAHRDGMLAVGGDHANAPGFALLSVAGEPYRIPTDAVLERGELDLDRFLPSLADDPYGTLRAQGRRVVHEGDRIWSGYVISGDQVFVNRLLWYLRPPRRDEIVVFATSASSLRADPAAAAADAGPDRAALVQRIPLLFGALHLAERPIPMLPAGQFYIKRLVGLPGETVSIDPPRLVVDGRPVDGCYGIDRETARGASPSGPSYAGYLNTGDPGMPPYARTFLATAEDSVRLGAGRDDAAYLPMGDNSRSSFDGRYWGPVPRRQMLGPAACVYWPLSVRWGRVR